MRIFFSILSIISTLLGFLMIVSFSQDGEIAETLSFGTKGMSFMYILNLYNFLGVLFAFPAERNKYRFILFTFSTIMLLISLSLTFVGLYGFQEP
ncbi:hypothetical protein [Niallia sp. FSL R7-0271]|uniref:hypothetical protein n=1 Tax=Niallia sp. FSL R7-0271 TaxID=2921678 RepID=UPI0030F61255